MLSERQRHIIVELTLVGRTAQYIADRFDCSISTILRIRIIFEGLRGASDFAHWPKSQRSLLHTLDIHFPNELSREGSMVRQSTAVSLYKNWTLVSRTGSDDNDGVPEPSTGQYQTTGPAYFLWWINVQPCILWREGEGMENSRVSMHGQ